VDWSNPLSCGDLIKKDDLIILVSAHVGYISHIPVLESLPTRLEIASRITTVLLSIPNSTWRDQLLETEDHILFLRISDFRFKIQDSRFQI
jgi:hypothetical protein